MRSLARVAICMACSLVWVAPADAGQPPPVGAHAGQLATAAAQMTESVGELRALHGRADRTPAEIAAAAGRLEQATIAARDVFSRYRDARIRDGSLSEFAQIRSIENEQLEALGLLQRLAGTAPRAPSAAERRAGRRARDDGEELIEHLTERVVAIEGLRDMLRGPVVRTVAKRLERNARQAAEDAANRALKRFTGVGVVIGVPLKEQVVNAATAAVANRFTALVVSAGAAGFLVQLVLGPKVERVIRLVGRVLREALRGKGRLPQRTARSIRGLQSLMTRWRAVLRDPDPSVAELRELGDRIAGAINGTRFLQEDLLRKRSPLLEDLQAAIRELQALTAGYEAVFRSEPLRNSMAGSAATAERARAEVAAIRARLPQALGPLRAPTAAQCVPGQITQTNGQRTATATFRELRTGSEYVRRCYWFWDDGSGEAYVVEIDFAGPDAQGSALSGDCGHTSDSPLRSDRRYLSVGGGSRNVGWYAEGGDETILRRVLAAAEAAGVGHPCP